MTRARAVLILTVSIGILLWFAWNAAHVSVQVALNGGLLTAAIALLGFTIAAPGSGSGWLVLAICWWAAFPSWKPMQLDLSGTEMADARWPLLLLLPVLALIPAVGYLRSGLLVVLALTLTFLAHQACLRFGSGAPLSLGFSLLLLAVFLWIGYEIRSWWRGMRGTKNGEKDLQPKDRHKPEPTPKQPRDFEPEPAQSAPLLTIAQALMLLESRLVRFRSSRDIFQLVLLLSLAFVLLVGAKQRNLTLDEFSLHSGAGAWLSGVLLWGVACLVIVYSMHLLSMRK